MTQKELERIRYLTAKIDDGMLKLEEIRSRAYPGAIKYDDTGASKASPTNKLEEVMELLDLQEQYIDSLIDTKYQLINQLVTETRAECTDPAERHVIYLRYIACMDWREIIDTMQTHHKIQRSKVYSLHHIAIEKLKHHNI